VTCSNFNNDESGCATSGCNPSHSCDGSFDCSNFNNDWGQCTAMPDCSWNPEDSTCSGTVDCANYDEQSCSQWSGYEFLLFIIGLREL
jgi:hypothetical protein